ncbi:MAG: O-antigen ligase C-terminal domain-containing protein [Burkholderiales bacterium]|nr:O-antigen ligase C-terminal domain-containing protein [Burkholderiales bacterium]
MVFFPFAYIFAAFLASNIAAAYVNQGKEKDISLAIAFTFISVALISVVLQHIQVFRINATQYVMYIGKEFQSNLRPFANVGQPNQLVLLFFLAIASIIYLYQREKINIFVVYLVFAMLLWRAALTQSRIGWVIIPMYALFLFFWGGNRRLVNVAIGIIVAYVIFVILLPNFGKMLGIPVASIANHVGGRSERIVLWKQAWHMAAEHPWFGVGWAGFGPEQVRIAADFGSSTYAEHSHNMILNFAAELGWPVTIVFFGYLTWWFYQTCIRPKQTAEIRFATMCLLAVFVHSMVEFPLWYAYVLIPVAVLMGMLDQMRWPSKGVQVHSSIVVSFLAITVFCMAAVTWDYQRVVAGFKALRLQLAGEKFDPKMMAMPQYTFFPQFFEYFRLMQIKPREGMSAQDIAYFEHWSRRFGFVHILNTMAEIYVLNGEPKKASREMLTLQRLHPDLYPEYFDYWKARAAQDQRYRAIFLEMPKRDAP